MTASPADARRVKRALALLEACERLEASSANGVLLERLPSNLPHGNDWIGTYGAEGMGTRMASLVGAIMALSMGVPK